MNVEEIRQERKYSQSFMLNMNVEDQCLEHFSEQEDDFIASQISRQFDPSVEGELDQVEVMKANLGAECPIFVKAMLPSNVISGFVLALPKQFCHSHLPLHDSTITLEDKSGEQYETKFIVQKEKCILSCGWRRFCSANKLVVGNVLVFHLVRPLKFKVYIMERHSLAEVDAAFSLLKLGACAKQTTFEGNHPMPLLKDVCQGHIDQKTSVTLDSNPTLIDDACAKQTAFEGNRPMPLLKDVCEGHIDQKTTVTLDSNPTEIDDEYNKEFGFNFLEEVGLQIPSADFEDVEKTENFTVLLNGVSINSHFSEQIRNRYYDLCCSQRTFLHDHLLKSINGKLAAEIITETTNIANAIRACKLSTPHAAYDQAALIRKSKEAKLERAREEEQARVKKEEEKELTLESRLSKWHDRILRAYSKVYRVQVDAKRRELSFQEEAVAPWE
ncbi:hypothetical protein M0R45_007824 [Rubus argutus]|uniref:TF-B3 domain-containing protein n=1 Tax=Rubus argutus TaxID=59490 RepID=A0AAW1Y069_RUBAR